jgi:hypothetical protein
MTTTGTVDQGEDLAETYLYCMKDQFVTGLVLHSNEAPVDLRASMIGHWW